MISLNFLVLLYVIFRLPFAASFPFAMALAQKEAELIVLRQSMVEARKAFAAIVTQQAEAARASKPGPS